MANTMLTIDEITREATRIFTNELKFVKSIDRQYDSSFAKSGAKIGTSLRIRKPAQVTVGTGATATAQDFQEDYTTLTVSTQNHVLLNFTSVEQTMSLGDFSKLVLQPVITRLANHVDATAMSTVYKNIYNHVGTAGSTPGTVTTWMAGTQLLNEMCTPAANRKALVSPAAEAATVVGFAGFYNAQNEVAKQYKTGTMSNALGYDWFMSQNAPTHTVGTWTTATSLTVTDVSTDTSIVKIVANAGSLVLKVGDIITMAGVGAVNPVTKASTGSLQTFVVTAETTVNTTGVNVSVSPSLTSAAVATKTVSALPTNGAAVTFKSGSSASSYPQNLLYVPDAFTFASADLELPAGAQGSRQVHENISLRIVRDYNITSDLNLCRVDVLWGIATQIPQNACRVTG